MYETRGTAKFWYYYDANGILYNVKYTLVDGGTTYSYYYTHNSRGDIIGIYTGSGTLVARYEYDNWGNVLSVKNSNGSTITNQNHIGNLNPFRYRGYYLDTETGLYYLMSRYYDPVVHRFINADCILDTSAELNGYNVFNYTANNPINNSDPSGHWIIKDAIKWITKNIVKPTVKIVKKIFTKIPITYSSGINLSGTTSIFSFNAQGGTTIDTKGNFN